MWAGKSLFHFILFLEGNRLITKPCMASLQERRLAQEIADLEKDTGFKLRVLAQNYPETPGLLHLFI